MTIFFLPARWSSSPYINRFLSADTIVPGYANPQSLNRYSYVTNNPLRYTDPTGHMRVQDGVQQDRVKKLVADKYIPKPKKKGKDAPSDGITIPFDTQEWAENVFPNLSPEYLRTLGTSLDEYALLADGAAEAIVLGHAVVGAIGISFEGTPVSGPIGAGAGWILGQVNPIVRGLVNGGNWLAAAGTGAGVLADLKTGGTRLSGALSVSENSASLGYNLNVSSSTEVAVSTTAIGFAAQITELSLGLQSFAVLSDHGELPVWQHTISGSMHFP